MSNNIAPAHRCRLARPSAWIRLQGILRLGPKVASTRLSIRDVAGSFAKYQLIASLQPKRASSFDRFGSLSLRRINQELRAHIRSSRCSVWSRHRGSSSSWTCKQPPVLYRRCEQNHFHSQGDTRVQLRCRRLRSGAPAHRRYSEGKGLGAKIGTCSVEAWARPTEAS